MPTTEPELPLLTKMFISCFILSALQNGWTVKQISQKTYEFKKLLRLENEHRRFMDPTFYIEGFIRVNSNLNKINELMGEEHELVML